MNSKTTPMVDGKQALLEFARAHHPRHEHSIAGLEKQLRRLGLELTAVDMDEDFISILGPLQTVTNVRTMAPLGGVAKVKHFDLVRAFERLLEVGLPVWKNEAQQFAWHCLQLEQCEPFQLPAVEQFETREELENHASNCSRCQPAFRMLGSAWELGSRRNSDMHLRELIEKSHADQAAALQFYTQIRDSQQMPFMTLETKPQRVKREQVVA